MMKVNPGDIVYSRQGDYNYIERVVKSTIANRRWDTCILSTNFKDNISFPKNKNNISNVVKSEIVRVVRGKRAVQIEKELAAKRAAWLALET